MTDSPNPSGTAGPLPASAPRDLGTIAGTASSLRRRLLPLLALLLACPAIASADQLTYQIDTGDTAWMLTSTALVLMMTIPGLALFYGGLVRKKNILSVMMQCMFLCGMMSIIWALWGYSLAFGANIQQVENFENLPAEQQEAQGGFIGGLDYVMMQGVLPLRQQGDSDVNVPMAGTIPHLVFFMFQGMFFIITPALICGAFAERMKFSAMCIFCALWGTFIYCPIAHWVWGPNGWLLEGQYAAYDFAGGTVVHISSGVAALAAALIIGPRIGHRKEPMPPHNLTYTFIGAALLWIGWFGFNAGSALAANGAAAIAFVSTHMAAAAGVVAWSMTEKAISGKATILGACSGAVAGLVCITPAAGVVTPIQAILLGLAAGIVCYLACTFVKNKLGYDDSLDAFGVHGVGGALGALLTGVFASPDILGVKDSTLGYIYTSDFGLVINQLIGVAASAGYSLIGSVVILFVLKFTIGLRVDADSERQGLDTSEHGEEGYIFL